MEFCRKILQYISNQSNWIIHHFGAEAHMWFLIKVQHRLCVSAQLPSVFLFNLLSRLHPLLTPSHPTTLSSSLIYSPHSLLSSSPCRTFILVHSGFNFSLPLPCPCPFFSVSPFSLSLTIFPRSESHSTSSSSSSSLRLPSEETRPGLEMGMADKEVIDKSDGEIKRRRRGRGWWKRRGQLHLLFSRQESSFDMSSTLPVRCHMRCFSNSSGLNKILSLTELYDSQTLS